MNSPSSRVEVGSRDYVAEHAYLVERGVRAMAIVGHVEANESAMLEVASAMETASAGVAVVPFVVARSDGFADFGFAASQWVVDLYTWLVGTDVPSEHAHRVRGLLLGYSIDAIRVHGERATGRRFTSSLERAPRRRSCDSRGKGGTRAL